MSRPDSACAPEAWAMYNAINFRPKVSLDIKQFTVYKSFSPSPLIEVPPGFPSLQLMEEKKKTVTMFQCTHLQALSGGAVLSMHWVLSPN